MTTSETSEAAKAVIRRNTEEVQGGGNFEVFEELFADDFLDHTPQPGRTPDKDGARQLYKILRTAFPDFHADIHWQLADGVTTYKTYIHAFARSLGSQLVDRGIRVNVVAPGPVWTPLNPADKPAKAVEKFGGDTPMWRPAQPEEIAPAFVFLAAPSCSSYITGEILPIIGGYSGG
jgi:hypothetical protein